MAIETSNPPLSSMKESGNAMERLIEVMQRLSQAKDLLALVRMVLREARQLTGADGASFILRDRDQCLHVEEDSIAPLWKGSRFAADACMSGWVMQHRQSVAIDDVYDDPRVPFQTYRSTFVRSMAIVPIRADRPVGAIGCFWAVNRHTSLDEIKLLEALAGVTVVALDTLTTQMELADRVEERATRLARAESEIDSLALEDKLTGLYNIRGFTLLAEQQLLLARRSLALPWLLYAQVDDLDAVNNGPAPEMSEKLIKTAAEVLRQTFRGHDVVARIDRGAFAVFGLSEKMPADFRSRLQIYIDAHNATSDDQVPLSMSFGLVFCRPREKVAVRDLLARAATADRTKGDLEAAPKADEPTTPEQGAGS